MNSKSLGPVDHLIEKVGIGMVQTVEAAYRRYCDCPSPKNAKSYCTWRLRLHRRLKNDENLLNAINDARNLGLHDTSPGRTLWDCTF